MIKPETVTLEVSAADAKRLQKVAKLMGIQTRLVTKKPKSPSVDQMAKAVKRRVKPDDVHKIQFTTRKRGGGWRRPAVQAAQGVQQSSPQGQDSLQARQLPQGHP